MAPPSNDIPPRRQSEQLPNLHSRANRHTQNMAQSTGAGVPARLRNDESWVEISSQPSSSSLSSVGDEVVTTGLRISQRRRRQQQNATTSRNILEARQASTSSQEEYEESESESEEDGVMTSSNEHIVSAATLPGPSPYDSGSDSDDDDEQATALGRRTEPTFTPQPNAFSHPPFSTQRPAQHQGSYLPPLPNPNVRGTNQNPYRVPSRQQSSLNNHHQDHDAALRASLTTLLSIGAAAARGLPKRNGSQGRSPMNMMSNEPMGIRFVPESELMAPSPPANAPRPLSGSPSTRPASTNSPSNISSEESKRKASSSKPSGEKSRALKKKRMQMHAVGDEVWISDRFLTWIVSAGVVVLVSVVGFGAGYVIGREVGRQETLIGFNSSTVLDANSCSREAVGGSTGSLKRFKWGIGGVARAVIA